MTSLPKFVTRDFKNYEELEIHHDNLLLDMSLDNSQQATLRNNARRVKDFGGCLSVLGVSARD